MRNEDLSTAFSFAQLLKSYSQHRLVNGQLLTCYTQLGDAYTQLPQAFCDSPP